MTSPVTFGPHLPKMEIAAENVIFNGFASNFNGAAFCLPQPIGGLLVSINEINITNNEVTQYITTLET